MTKKKIFLWACDYSQETGEGNLARKFVEDKYHKKKIIIKTLKSDNIFCHKYIITLVGIFYCWKFFIKGYSVGYLNYLPLWNFLIFSLLPPKTFLGPITGGSFYTKKNEIDFIIRRFIFPFFYKISEFFLNIRLNNKIIFSTELLKNNLSQITLGKSEFNYVIKKFKFKKKFSKKIDFLLYHRIHKNKITFFDYDLIVKLVKSNLKVVVVGDRIDIKGLKNCGYVNKKKINNLQSRSKFTLCSGENIYSFFVLECISNHVKILISKNYKNQIKFFKKYFITFDDRKFNFKKIKKK